ncbi:MAG: secondary thiamine-phosphate synthase enzyme YjbQ [Bacteroidota bacterium]
MKAWSTNFSLSTKGFSDVIDLTPQVESWLATTAVRDGTLTLFVHGSTAGITTIEHESGAIADLKGAIERMAPQGITYAHDDRWGDGNGFAHVRAALLGPSLSIPLVNGSLALGTWQQIVVVDFDNRPRRREIIAQLIGE